jgi:putative heme iron utilization protein
MENLLTLESPTRTIEMSADVIEKIHRMHETLARLDERGTAASTLAAMIEKRLDQIEAKFTLVYTGVFLSLLGALLSAVLR